jgi:hypothetical protein
MRGEAGDAAGAVAAYEQLLEDFLRVFGPDHPNTLTIRTNLSYWLQRSPKRSSSLASFAGGSTSIFIFKVITCSHEEARGRGSTRSYDGEQRPGTTSCSFQLALIIRQRAHHWRSTVVSHVRRPRSRAVAARFMP